MKIKNKKFEGFIEIIPDLHRDKRGFLARLYDENIFKSLGLNTKWAQESHHHTYKKNTLRGLHVQTVPFSEGKLLRVVRGKLLWIVVDLRKKSKTFGQWDSVVLSGELENSIYIKPGFGHGCLSLTDNVDLIIKSDNYFSPEHGVGIIWNDKDLNVDWGLKGRAIISERDKSYPNFEDFKKKYGGI